MLIAITTIGCDVPNGTRNGTVSSPDSSKSDVDRDNSAVNKRDADRDTKTPLDQNENQSDINITAEIRKRVVDTQMSVNAQNVKIITQDGKVTLRGPVKTADEKKRIEEMARSVAGETNVQSQLEVEQTP
jgi:osmotically-inducible protein OsmY